MTTRDQIAPIGVHPQTLTDTERAQLDRDGYLPLAGIMPPCIVALFRDKMAALLAAEGADAGKEVHQEAGTDRLANLVDKDPLFEYCLLQTRVLAGITHVLGPDFHLSSLNSRFALPGQGLQGLHADWGAAVEPGDYSVCNSIWLLDDFTADNGATRVVPGSHRSGKHPSELGVDLTKPHPDEVILQAPAGTVVIFNAHTWHGGTLNRTAASRRAMHVYWSRRDLGQQTNQRESLSAATKARLSPLARYLLDVE